MGANLSLSAGTTVPEVQVARAPTTPSLVAPGTPCRSAPSPSPVRQSNVSDIASFEPFEPFESFGAGIGAPVQNKSDAAAEASASEALRRDLLAFYDQHEGAFADLILHTSDGQVVLANCAIVEARLPLLLSAAEPLREADPALLVMERERENEQGRRVSRAETFQQVRLRGFARPALELLLRWAYGEAVPSREGFMGEGVNAPLGAGLNVIFDVLEACWKYELERLGALLREALLEALDVEHFAVVLRESHVRRIHGLKQGCMRFALHHFDELIDRPEVFVSPLQELPEVVSDLFRLSRRWKDETDDGRSQGGRGGSPRPAPAPPSTFIGDFGRLFAAARLEEERGTADADDTGHIEEEEVVEGCCGRRTKGRQDLTPDCRVRVGEDVYLGHSAVLAARSDFFRAAFASNMVEQASQTVTLQHVQGEVPRRESVLALLYFLYTGRTSKVNGSNAMDILALIGGEHSGEDVNGGDRGYLQLHDVAPLRLACEVAAERACAAEGSGFLSLLAQAHALGAQRLKARAMRLAVHHFKDIALHGGFGCLPPPLLTEVLRLVAVEYDRSLPSAAKGLKWELSMLPAPDGRLENTYEAVNSPDLSCGAGASGAAGCSEASLVATFDRAVRVRRVRIGVDLTIGDFDAARLNGTKLQCMTPSGTWQDTGVAVSVDDGVVQEIELPQVQTARAFRLVRKHRLAVGLLVFE